MIIPWLLDPHLFDSDYLSRDNEALEEMLELYESFTLWPLSEKIRLLIYQQLESLIEIKGEGPIVARAQSLKSMLSIYIKNHGVMVSDSKLIDEEADQFNLHLLQDVPPIEGLVTNADRKEILRSCCPESRRNYVCNLEKRRESPLQERYLQISSGALANPDREELMSFLNPFLFWASKITIIDRYIGSNFQDFDSATSNRDKHKKKQWVACRNSIRFLYECWGKGTPYLDKISFNIISMYEPDKETKDRYINERIPFDLKKKQTKQIVEGIIDDLGISESKLRVSIIDIENRQVKHDRYLVFGDNQIAVGLSSGLAQLRPDGSGTIDLYRRTSKHDHDKISKILAKGPLVHSSGDKARASAKHENPFLGRSINDGLSLLDEAFKL